MFSMEVYSFDLINVETFSKYLINIYQYREFV